MSEMGGSQSFPTSTKGGYAASDLRDESRLISEGFSVTVKNPRKGREYLDRPPQHQKTTARESVATASRAPSEVTFRGVTGSVSSSFIPNGGSVQKCR